VNAEGFQADILAEPEALERVAGELGGAGLERLLEAPRVLFLGMGSSAYAAANAAALLRSRGADAHVELASTGTPQPPSPDTAAVVISASGGSSETVEAMRRHLGTSRVVALTNRAGSPLAEHADVCVDVLAGEEAGGIACRSFACTQAVLALMCGRPADEIRRTAEAAAGVWAAAPAERFGTAQQSALMLREAPRIVADACETGDWLHVDVYLTKRPRYALLLLTGSRYDAEVLEWRAKREFAVFAVGDGIAGADLHIPFPGAGEHTVAAIAATVVAELLAAELWRRHPI
jgi:glutamine---fructose-6-phosphate transaminase (isomerizing)